MRARAARRLAGVLCTCAALTAQAATTPLVEDTPDAACEILKARVAELLIANARPDHTWYCEKGAEQKYLYILALRTSRAPDADEAATNLIGWYAVARRSNVVLQWDVATDRLVALAGRPPRPRRAHARPAPALPSPAPPPSPAAAAPDARP